MIEINLLPGAGKKKASRGGGGAKLDLAATFAGISTKVKDKWLAAAVISAVVCAAAIGILYTVQDRQADDLSQRLNKALQDSSHNSAVMTDMVHSEAKRDTLLRQLHIIQAIDNDRFVWAHVMDEVSRALPPYTWLTDLAFTGTPQGTNNPAAAPAKPAGAAAPPPPPADAAKDTSKKAAPAKKKRDRLPTDVAQDTVRIRLQGRTVDIQALTRFMKDLEASPFLGNVQLEKSEMVIDGGQQVTQFSLTMNYTRPDTSAIRRVAFGAAVR